jgi:ArsR family transcriptional regulator
MSCARQAASSRVGARLLCARCILLLSDMDLLQVYQCFCDQTRLRILHLLASSPLCVCHFQEIFREPQVKISKHLAYLRSRGMVVSEREQNWMIYSLPESRPTYLQRNLKCLQDCVQMDRVFKRDLERLARLRKRCCEPHRVFGNAVKVRKRSGKAKSPVHLRS